MYVVDMLKLHCTNVADFFLNLFYWNYITVTTTCSI